MAQGLSSEASPKKWTFLFTAVEEHGVDAWGRSRKAGEE
jgi:hypothetical protein